MFKIFRKSFRFRDIFSLKDESLGKFILYFLMMILVASFPLNYQIFRSDGFDGLTRFTQYLRNHLELEFIDSLPSENLSNGFLSSGRGIPVRHRNGAGNSYWF